MRTAMTTKKKSFNASLDDILADLELPTDAEVREETGKVKRAEGLKNPKVRAKISQGIKSSTKWREAMINRDQSFRNTKKYQKEHKERMQALRKDPKFVESHKRGMEELRRDPVRWAEYQKNYAKGNTAKYDNPEFWENYYKAIAVRDADPEYHKRRIAASNAKIAIKVITPAGEFDSISDAARHYGMTSEGMRNRVNSDKYPDFYKTSDVAKKPQKKKK